MSALMAAAEVVGGVRVVRGHSKTLSYALLPDLVEDSGDRVAKDAYASGRHGVREGARHNGVREGTRHPREDVGVI